jgi:hypothetical protein
VVFFFLLRMMGEGEVRRGTPTSRPLSMRESVAPFGVTRSTLDAPLGLPALPAPSTARAFANERPPGFGTTWLTWATSEETTVVREERVDSKNVPL